MEEIYKKYSKLVIRYLYGLTNNIELAEELMQETFYSAIKGLNKFRNECKISVWLCQIAKNKWKDYMVKKQKINLIPFDESLENNFFYDDMFENLKEKNDTADLYKKIKKLDKETREVFYFRIKAELSFKEIAQTMGKSEEWARVTFYRGKLKIKEELSKNEK